MTRNPDYLMGLKPSELKSLSDGEFRIYCGMKFETLEKANSKLEKRFWVVIITMISTLATVLLSSAL